MKQQQLKLLQKQSGVVKEIFDNVFQELEFNYFNYQILYDDGRRVHLNANPDWLENYYKKKYYNIARCDKRPSSYIDGFGLWDLWEANEVSKDVIENFNSNHGIVFTKRFNNCAFVIELATFNKNCQINEFYIHNIEKLQNLIYTFNDKAEHLIKNSIKNAFTLNKYNNDDILKCEYLNAEMHDKFLQKLTNKEMLYIHYELQEKTSTEIGLLLNIPLSEVKKLSTKVRRKIANRN